LVQSILEQAPKVDLRRLYRETGISVHAIPIGKQITISLPEHELEILLACPDEPGQVLLSWPSGSALLNAKPLPTVQNRGSRTAISCPSCERWVEVITFHNGEPGCRVCQRLIHKSTRDSQRPSKLKQRFAKLLAMLAAFNV
jgi:hypothetical protein